MSSFKDFNIPKSKPKKKQYVTPTSEGFKYSNLFLQIVKKIDSSRDVLQPDYPLREWAKQFTILLSVLKCDRKRLQKVLTWYTKHWKWKYCPKITDGKTFRYRFADLESTMQRWKQDNPNIKVRKKFIDLAADRFGIGPGMNVGYFSPSFVKQFPVALQLTHDNFTKLFEWVWTHEKYCFFYQECLPHPSDFVIDWWKELDHWFSNPNHRKINPLSLIFVLNPKNKRTDKWINWWIDNRGLTPEIVHNMIKEVMTSISKQPV